MFKFFGSIAHEMKMTTWPTRKESIHDFFMVVEYTIFYLIFIMIFDWIAQNGITHAVQYLLPFVQK